MRRIEMTWDDGQWGPGVADEIAALLVEALRDQRRAEPDSVRVVNARNLVVPLPEDAE